MPDKDDLDLLLDSALSTYADPGPASGLEQRVLTALAAPRSAVRPRRWLAWAIAVPVAASLLLWIGIKELNHPQLPVPQQQASQGHPSPSSQDSQAANHSQPPPHPVLKGHDLSRAVNAAHSRRASTPEGRVFTARLQNPAALPKLAVFPSPQPLTREEQALIAATRGYESQRTALLEAAKPPSDAPLAIADLSIPPLVPPDEGKK